MVFSGIPIQWFADDPDITHGAAGRRDVLHIVSNPSTTSPNIAPRRSRGPLTETERRKLEKQGIHRDCQHTDLSIMTTRERLDKRYAKVTVFSGENAACGDIKSQIANYMSTTDKEGSK